MQDAQQSDAAQQVEPLLPTLPAQQHQQPSLHLSATSAVAAASSYSHLVDATGHQYTAEPAAGELPLPKAVSPMTDQCASGADELPAAVDAQSQHHTAGPDQSEVPVSAPTYTVDTVPEHEVTAVAPASQPSTAEPGQSETSASASAHALDTAAVQQSAPVPRSPSAAIRAQPSAEHAETCDDAAGTAGENTANQVAVTNGVDTAVQQQSPGSQQPEQTSQTAAHTVLAEVDTNSQQHTARLAKRTALPPSSEPRLKRHKLNAAEDKREQQGGSEGPSLADQDATRPMSAGEGEQGEQAVGSHMGDQGETAPAAQAAPALPLGSMPTGNTLPLLYAFAVGLLPQAYAQRGRVYKLDKLAFSCITTNFVFSWAQTEPGLHNNSSL